jgi:hypothetical protein
MRFRYAVDAVWYEEQLPVEFASVLGDIRRVSCRACTVDITRTDGNIDPLDQIPFGVSIARTGASQYGRTRNSVIANLMGEAGWVIGLPTPIPQFAVRMRVFPLNGSPGAPPTLRFFAQDFGASIGSIADVPASDYYEFRVIPWTATCWSQDEISLNDPTNNPSLMPNYLTAEFELG